jgi:hypothetical protein
MAKTLLQIATQALGELGLTAPTLIASNSDVTAVQILSLLNREGSELADVEGGWPQLRGQQSITLVPGQEAYSFPTDILYYRQGSTWDQTSHWQVVGPLSDREWQLVRSGLSVSPPFPALRYRIMNDQVHFDPVPGTADTIIFEYVSANWCKSNTGTPQSQFLADTDMPILPDDLFVLGLKWRLLAAKGMNYAEERAAYDAAVSRKQGRAFNNGPLPLNRRRYRGQLDGWPLGPITVTT